MNDFKIQSVLNSLQTNVEKKVDKNPEAEGKSFSEILKDTIGEVNDLQKQSDEEIMRFVSGENTDVHSAMLAMQKADISFQTMMQIRNKILDAYKEIMRTQV